MQSVVLRTVKVRWNGSRVKLHRKPLPWHLSAIGYALKYPTIWVLILGLLLDRHTARAIMNDDFTTRFQYYNIRGREGDLIRVGLDIRFLKSLSAPSRSGNVVEYIKFDAAITADDITPNLLFLSSVKTDLERSPQSRMATELSVTIFNASIQFSTVMDSNYRFVRRDPDSLMEVWTVGKHGPLTYRPESDHSVLITCLSKDPQPRCEMTYAPSHNALAKVVMPRHLIANWYSVRDATLRLIEFR